MAGAAIKTNIQVILTLSEDEAVWLKQLVQNPINVAIENESEADSRIRQTIWNALADDINI